MKYIKIVAIILIIFPKLTFGQNPKTRLDSTLNGSLKIWQYLYEDIDLSNGKQFFSENNKIISKDEFFSLLNTGNYLPINVKNDVRNIGLLKFNQNQLDIQEYTKGFVAIEFAHFNWEKKDFPEFNFTDIDGNLFTNSSLKGKKILLKCWFINCTACVAEFPEVNKLIEKYSNRNDIEYLSLAFEGNEPLRKFLVNKPLNYKVIGNQKDYIFNTLKVNLMPTHFLIDENGKVFKVVNNVNALKTSVKDLLGY